MARSGITSCFALISNELIYLAGFEQGDIENQRADIHDKTWVPSGLKKRNCRAWNRIHYEEIRWNPEEGELE